MANADKPTIGDILDERGISRRSFLKFCMITASAMALPPMMGRAMAEEMIGKKRPSVIYLSFQECTGCLESFTRSFSPSLEHLLFNVISLDYNHTLMAAAGHNAVHAREQAMKDNEGEYVIIVDGSIPLADGGVYHCGGGISAEQELVEAAKGAAAIVAVGTCAAFGGIPHARPNPTGAVPVTEIIRDKPVVNVSGCPPIPAVITGTLLHYYGQGRLPDLDRHGRPLAFFGNSIHDRCYRRPFYDQGKFAKSFDDEGARNGWCLYELGCKGPTTYNACATMKWNEGTSFPIESGHPCIGCSEPDFWDEGSFYAPQSATTMSQPGVIGLGAAAGVAVGAAAAYASRKHSRKLEQSTDGED